MPTGSGSISFLSAFGIGVTGKNSAIHSNAVTNDPAGDTFITGSFRGTASFDPNSSAATFTTNGTQDTFVAKYALNGTLLWAKTFAGQTVATSGGGTITAVSQGAAIAVDGSGNVFVAGSYSGTVDLAGPSGVTEITTPSSTTEIYLAKLAPSGSLTWLDTVAGTQYDTDEAYALALDGSGGAVIAGSFQDSATFGPTTLTAGGVFEAFAARVNAGGTFLWAVASQGTPGSNAEIHGVAVDASGNVDLAGFFSSTVDFDPGPATSNLVSAGSDDAVLWKLDANGHFLWARGYGSADYDAAAAIAVDASGNIYTTGTFSDSVNFGTATASDTLAAGPIFDTFVLKLDPNGNEVWVKGLIGPGGWSKGQGIAVEPLGNVDLDGTFQGLIDFDPNSGTDNLTSVGNTDVFVVGLDPGGNLLSALQAGQTNFNAALGIAVNPSDLVSITGTDTSAISFGSTNIPAIGTSSVFVARVSTQPPPLAPSAPALEPSSDTGPSQSDGITSVTSPIFDVNTAASANTVELLRNGIVVGQRTGPGAIQDPGPLAAGTDVYTAVQVSPIGQAGPASPATSVMILTQAPLAPPAPTLVAADDSGTIGDGITNLRQPRLSVVAKAQTTVQLLNAAGLVIGSAFATANGSYLITPAQPLADGSYVLDARAVDLAGNVGPVGATFTLTILATPIPTPATPTVLAADISGPAGSSITDVRQPRITGFAKAGTVVNLDNAAGSIVATTIAASDGSYTAKIASPLNSGLITLDAIASDVAGNVSPASATLSFTIDYTAPTAPSILGLVSTDDSGTVGDNITNVRQPHLSGTAEVGSTVRVVDGSGKSYGSAVVPSGGKFSVLISSPLGDGTYPLEAQATDLAGNVGPVGPSFSLTILGTAPAAPAAPALLAADDSGGPGLTNVRQPRLTGKGAANGSVQILGPTGVLYASATTGVDGSYVAQVSSPLGDGTYALHAVTTDVAGNISPAGSTFSLTILATPPNAPTAPTLLGADDSGTVGDNITNVRQPRLTGTAAPGLTIRLVNASNTVLGTATAAPSTGSFTVIPSTPLVDGTYPLRFVAVDAAGNVSPASGSIGLVILANPPVQPAIPGLLPADDTGIANDGMTSITRPRIAGTAAPGGRVDWIAGDGSVLGSGTASALNGSYQVQPTAALPNGTYAVRVRETDAAGNVSPISLPFSLTIRVAAGDDFADSQSDPAVFQPSTDWYNILRTTTNGLYTIPFGIPGDVPVNGDFFGDGHDDLTLYRPSNSTFYSYDLNTNTYLTVQLGQAGDVPVPADFDGDGKTDFAVFRPSIGTWFVKMSSTNTVVSQAFAIPGDIPIPANYLGLGRADFAVYRPSTSTFFAYDPTSGGYKQATLGTPGSTPVPADYEGIGHADFAAFQPSNLTWSILMSATNSVMSRGWGIPGDSPVSGDYFGDGRTDLTVYRSSTSTFFSLNLNTGAVKVAQVGTPNVFRPVLAPITTWFTFGSTPGGRAISPTRSIPGSATLNFAFLPDRTATPDATVTATSTRKASTIDRALTDLGLDRWRPGS